MRLTLLATCAFAVLASAALAEGDHQGPPAGLDAALKQCASTVAKDQNGKPDHQAMHACMEAKGFKPPHGGHGGPPPGEGGGSGHDSPPPDAK